MIQARLHSLVSLPLVLAACSRAPSPAPAAAPLPVAVPVPVAAPAAVAAPVPAVVAAPVPAERPHTCEVEMSGRLELPKGAPKGDANYVFVALGDCLAPEPKVIGWGGNTYGKFFVEVFVPWGSDISLCAVSIAPPGQPSTLYAKAATPMHAEAEGEIEFKNLVVALRPGPPHLFPRPPGR